MKEYLRLEIDRENKGSVVINTRKKKTKAAIGE